MYAPSDCYGGAAHRAAHGAPPPPPSMGDEAAQHQLLQMQVAAFGTRAATPLYLAGFLDAAVQRMALKTFGREAEEGGATHVTLAFKPDEEALRGFPFGQRGLVRCRRRRADDAIDAVAVDLEVVEAPAAAGAPHPAPRSLQQRPSEAVPEPVTHLCLASAPGVKPGDAHALLRREAEQKEEKKEEKEADAATQAFLFYVTFGCAVGWPDGRTTVVFDRNFFSSLAERRLQQQRDRARADAAEAGARLDAVRREVEEERHARDAAHAQQMQQLRRHGAEQFGTCQGRLTACEFKLADAQKELAAVRENARRLAEAVRAANDRAAQESRLATKRARTVDALAAELEEARRAQDELRGELARRKREAEDARSAAAAPEAKDASPAKPSKRKKKKSKGTKAKAKAADDDDDEQLLRECIAQNARERLKRNSVDTQTQPDENAPFEVRAEESWYDRWLTEREVNVRHAQQHSVLLSMVGKLRRQVKELQTSEVDLRGDVAAKELEKNEARAVITVLKNESVWMKRHFVNSEDATFRAICGRSNVPHEAAELVLAYAGVADRVDIQSAMADSAMQTATRMADLLNGEEPPTPGKRRLAGEIADFQARINLELANYLRDSQIQQHEFAKLQSQSVENVRLRNALEAKHKENLDVHRLALDLAHESAADQYFDVFARQSRQIVHAREVREAMREWGGGADAADAADAAGGATVAVPRAAVDAAIAAIEVLAGGVAGTADDAEDDRLHLYSVSPLARRAAPVEMPTHANALVPTWEKNVLLGADCLERADRMNPARRAEALAEGKARRDRLAASTKRLALRAYGPCVVSARAHDRLRVVREEAIASLRAKGDPSVVFAEFFSRCKKQGLLDDTTLALLNAPPPVKNIDEAFFRSVRPGMQVPGAVEIVGEAGEGVECEVAMVKRPSSGTDAASARAAPTPTPRSGSRSP